MLEGAPAANAEMAADRIDPVPARSKHGKELNPVVAWRDRDPDTLAGQSEGDVEGAVRPFGDAVALGTEMRDLDLTLHDAPRSKIPRCRCHP